MTVHALAGWAGDYSGAQVNSLLRALRTGLADCPPISVTVGPALCSSSGVILDVAQTGTNEPMSLLYRRVRMAISGVFGQAGLGPSGWPPHISLAYGTATRDSGEIQSPLRRRVRPGRAPLRIDSVYLCEVRQDANAHKYTWRTSIRVPLGSVGAVG